ncbi:MAG TPA: hypothetical protein DCL41_10655 [Bdellovibrionales bacterium]|nr:hypothetical protein [Pseudobdellovibrionaceae bacterium]HAG92326.1 hypothetical protein [Bdellovibrionales bacterium]
MGVQKWILKLALGGLTFSIMACSGVEFTPANIQQSLSTAEPITPVEINPVEDKSAEESFYPNPVDSKPKVDILFVIDNSASMELEQQKLGDRLSAFIGTLDNVDWQIGITTTDTSNGRFGQRGSLVPLVGTGGQYILNKNTPNYETVFSSTVVRPEGINCGSNCPSVKERPLEASMMALGKGLMNGLIRQNAELAIVILSDADENGNGQNLTATPETLVATANTIFFGQKRLTGFGIIIEPGDVNCLNDQRQFSRFSYYGNQVAGLAALTGGVTGSVCDSNYSQSLTKIGHRVLNLVTSITLSKMPVEGSVKLTLNPADPNITWSIDGKKIEFSTPPSPGTRVDVKYLVEDDRH